MRRAPSRSCRWTARASRRWISAHSDAERRLVDTIVPSPNGQLVVEPPLPVSILDTLLASRATSHASAAVRRRGETVEGGREGAPKRTTTGPRRGTRALFGSTSPVPTSPIGARRRDGRGPGRPPKPAAPRRAALGDPSRHLAGV